MGKSYSVRTELGAIALKLVWALFSLRKVHSLKSHCKANAYTKASNTAAYAAADTSGYALTLDIEQPHN